MKNPAIQVLTKEEMDQIHYATLQVLQNPGILINHDKSRELCRKAGCDVDDRTKVVRFPQELVAACLSKCPESFTLFSRNGKKDLRMVSDGSLTNYSTFGIGVKTTHYRGQGRYDILRSTLKDVAEISKIVDACDNVDEICQPVTALDYATAGCCRTIREVDAVVSNTVKPFWPDTEWEYMDLYKEYEDAVYSGDSEEAFNKPFMMPCGCPSSPLQIDFAAAQIYTSSYDYGMPVMVLSMAMGAASAPIYLAGTLVTHNAEVIAGVVLAQLAHPGCPVMYGSSTTSFDFYCDSAPVGSPELGLISACVAQLAQYYHLPCVVAGT